MSMTVRDLIERLEDCEPDAEVRLAHQPSWPLAFGISGVAEGLLDEDGPDCTCGYDDCARHSASDGVVWIAEGHPADNPYAPKAVWEVAF